MNSPTPSRLSSFVSLSAEATPPPTADRDTSGPLPNQFEQGGVSVGRSAHVDCPTCEAELTIGEIESCQFAGCPKCSGMLFTQSVFSSLIRYLRASSGTAPQKPVPLNRDALQVRRACPGCGNTFETHPYGGPGNAVIDSCFGCQLIWLDRDELTKLVEAPGLR